MENLLCPNQMLHQSLKEGEIFLEMRLPMIEITYSDGNCSEYFLFH